MDFVRTGEGSPIISSNVEFKDWSWDHYYRMLIESCIKDKVSLAGRVALLDEAQYIFKKYESFKDVPVSIRKNLAGIIKKTSVEHGYNPETDWYLFGRNILRSYYCNAMKMTADYVPQNQLEQELVDLRDAIDLVPLSGAVNKTIFNHYQKDYRCMGDNPRASASRLLAMKRPDLFICVNGSNVDKLKALFGISGDLTWNTYWQDIVEKVQTMEWYKQAKNVRPEGAFEAKCAKYCVALLDCLTDDQHS